MPVLVLTGMLADKVRTAECVFRMPGFQDALDAFWRALAVHACAKRRDAGALSKIGNLRLRRDN